MAGLYCWTKGYPHILWDWIIWPESICPWNRCSTIETGAIIAIGIELHADDDDDDVNRRNVELELILSQLVSGQISHNPKGPQQVH